MNCGPQSWLYSIYQYVLNTTSNPAQLRVEISAPWGSPMTKHDSRHGKLQRLRRGHGAASEAETQGGAIRFDHQGEIP